MVFLTALTTFWIATSDITVVTCDADWMDGESLKQMLTAELSEFAGDSDQGIIASADRCTEESIRLRMVISGRGREREIRIDEIPKEARMRTIALALGELAREPDTETCASAQTTSDTPVGVESDGESFAPTKIQPEDDKIHSASKSRTPASDAFRRFSIGLFARGFPLAYTVAPEARFGVFFSRWRLSLGGYGMGWTSELGTAYLLSVTLMGGPVLWHYDGKISIGVDLLTELGALVVFGSAEKETVYKPKFNIAVGAHLVLRLGPNPKKRFHPIFTLECGWLRGLGVYAADTFQGGFEGLSLSGGMIAAW